MIFSLEQIKKLKEDNIISEETYNNLINYFDNYTYDENSYSEEDRKLIQEENKKGNFDIFSDKDLLNARRNNIISENDFVNILNAFNKIKPNQINSSIKIRLLLNKILQMKSSYLIKRPLNLISLFLIILSIHSFKSLWIIGGFLLIFITLPIVICISLMDAIINSDSSVLNFISLLIIVHFFESLFIGQDIVLYFIWLAILLFALGIFNFLKKNSILKYSTALVLCFTLMIHIVMLIIGK